MGESFEHGWSIFTRKEVHNGKQKDEKMILVNCLANQVNLPILSSQIIAVK